MVSGSLLLVATLLSSDPVSLRSCTAGVLEGRGRALGLEEGVVWVGGAIATATGSSGRGGVTGAGLSLGRAAVSRGAMPRDCCGGVLGEAMGGKLRRFGKEAGGADGANGAFEAAGRSGTALNLGCWLNGAGEPEMLWGSENFGTRVGEKATNGGGVFRRTLAEGVVRRGAAATV